MNDPLSDWPKSRLLGIVTLARRFGIFEEELLAGTGCTLAQISDPRTSQPLGVEFGAIRNLERLVGPDVPVGFYAGLDHHVRASCNWQQAVSTSAQFGQALALATRYIDLSLSLVRVEMLVEETGLRFRHHSEHLPEDVRYFLTVRALVCGSVTVRELLGHPLPLQAVELAFPRPVYADLLDDFTGVQVRWDADETVVSCDPRWLDQPLTSADRQAHESAVHRWQHQLERYHRRDGVSAKLREQIATAGLAAASLADSADTLGISERTLRRHLASEGTSYRQLLDEVRLEEASRHLLAGMSIEETARSVGYTHASAFAQAFRRWTGTSPDAWRHSKIRRPAARQVLGARK